VAESSHIRRCALTGASGYVGGHIARRLADAGWDVLKLGRQAGENGVSFRLGETVSPDMLRECTVLVHCAYDFAPVEWTDIHNMNVLGTAKLFDAAREAGVPRIILISTISAFEGCRSRYGRAKLEMERLGNEAGACLIRPGLVYGPDAGGMYGRLSDQAKKASIIPMPGGGRYPQYLVHHEDLAAAVLAAIDRDSVPKAPVTVAHGRPWPLRDIILEIARAYNLSPFLVPVPWRSAWVGLRVAELIRLPIGLRSDSLISLIYQNPAPSFNAKQELGIECRSFDTEFYSHLAQPQGA
jgi:nucleoside-diphosphate-sugar epimerase